MEFNALTSATYSRFLKYSDVFTPHSQLFATIRELFAHCSHTIRTLFATIRTLFAHYSQLFATIRTPRSYKLRGDFTMNRCPCVQREGSPEIEQVGKPSTSSLYSHLIHKYSQVFAGIRELFARCSRTIRKVFARYSQLFAPGPDDSRGVW